jgi:hypothetical protein
MELSENERLMLVKKKEEIFKISDQLLTGKLSASEKISKMNEILSLLSTIEGYAKPDRDLSVLPRIVLEDILCLKSGMDAELKIALFCTIVNSIKFDFTKKKPIVSIPVHIKELILSKFQIG